MSRGGGRKVDSPKAHLKAGLKRKKPIKFQSADWYEKAARSVAIRATEGSAPTAGGGGSDLADSGQDASERAARSSAVKRRVPHKQV
jgi:hypothetical protein